MIGMLLDAPPYPLKEWEALTPNWPPYALVPTIKLAIDTRFQRELSRQGWGAIDRICAEFNEAKFGVLVGVWRDDLFVIVDGQHRAIAAMRRQLPAVPAIAFENDVAASVFIGVNRDRLGLTKPQLFRAEVIAGDPVAVQVQRVLDQVGFTVPAMSRTKPQVGEILCTEVLKREMAGNPARLTYALKMLAAVDQDRTEGEGVATQHVVRAVLFVIKALMRDREVRSRVPAELALLTLTLRSINLGRLTDDARKQSHERDVPMAVALGQMIASGHHKRGGIALAVTS